MMNSNNLALENGSIIQIVGPSGSGKTFFTCQLLRNKNSFQYPIKKIYWHSGIAEGEAGATLNALGKLDKLVVVKGLPKGWIDRPKQGDVIVIDDLFEEVNRDATSCNQLFTKIARHRGVTVLFLTQNLFHAGGKHRTRNLNTHYLVIFKNPRDRTVIDFVSRQAFPQNRKFLMNVFDDITTNSSHSYVFLDFTQDCPDDLRVQSDLFNTEEGVVIYKQHKY
jgi:GTPase SAR1 family protein